MSKRVLIVDDFKYNLEFEEKVIGLLVKEHNISIEVESAMNVAEARKKIEENPPYDIVIVDINLPDGTGIDIAKEAREKSGQTKIAALTLYPDEYEQASDLFDLLLRKPIMPTTYKQKFEKLLDIV